MKVRKSSYSIIQLINQSSNWENFNFKLKTLSKKQKGDAFELLTKLYFKLDPKYQFYNEIWLWSEVPKNVLEILKLPDQDIGIDLIAICDDTYHPIQCKYYSDKNTSLTFQKVSTFISLFESNNHFKQGYLCSTAADTSKNYKKLSTKPIILLLNPVWASLDEEFFKKAQQLLIGVKTPLNPLTPRPHQIKAIKAANNHFVNLKNTRGKLIYPCATGKTLIGFWITQSLKSKSIIVAVPSLGLIKQNLEVYLREIVALKLKSKWLCICSDKDIGQKAKVIELTENIGVPCYTDPKYISQWMLDNINEQIIIFTTYQSGKIISEITKKLKFTFNIGIFDEAHKTAGSKGNLFSHLLFEKNINISNRIFMTATEKFYTGYKDAINSMDDTKIYGYRFAEMNFKEAIEQKLLTDYKIITVEVKSSEISNYLKNNTQIELNIKQNINTDIRSLVAMIALRKAMEQFHIKHAVSYHSTIAKAIENKNLQKFLTKYYKYSDVDIYSVSSNISHTKRNDIINEFSLSSKAIITNSRCLTEGIDIPNIDCILFADPRKSKIDIVQALGRALRLSPKKDFGYVILPIVYDKNANKIEDESFKDILSIIRALASNDSRIVEYFKEKKTYNRNTNRKNSNPFNFISLTDNIDADKLNEELNIKLWDKLSKLYTLPFNETRTIIQSFKLKNVNDWRKYCRSGNKPSNIPSTPHEVYLNSGWKSWGDFLGTGRTSDNKRIYKSYKDARALVFPLSLKSQKEWWDNYEILNIPEDIPKHPQQTYKNKGWKDWGHWLGTNRKQYGKIEYLYFFNARNFIRTLNLKNSNEWYSYCKSGNKPTNIPANPQLVYKNKGWAGLGDWIGTMRIADQFKIYLDYELTKKFVQSLNIKTGKDWKEYCKSGNKPDNIPAMVSQVYKNKGWKGWADWLSTKPTRLNKGEFLSYKTIQNYALKQKIKTQKEWYLHWKNNNRPLNIPYNPQRVFKDNYWKGWGDFLKTN